MPELPEVETVRRGLEPRLVGREIVSVEIADPRVTRRSHLDPASCLPGAVVLSLRRRGKWLLADLDTRLVLLLHLRMSGRLLLGEAPPGERAASAVLRLDDGNSVRFVDQRRFGELLVLAPGAAGAFEARIGPDADAVTTAHLRAAFAGRSRLVKGAITDQSLLGGVGNMYADEALWRARLHPDRRCDSLTDAELRRLARGLRSVLRAALAAGGTSTRDGMYVDADGRQGWFAVALSVYQREGRPCPRCGAGVERVRRGATASRVCPACQPAPERSPR